MTVDQVVVIIAGLCAGYWIVAVVLRQLRIGTSAGKDPSARTGEHEYRTHSSSHERTPQWYEVLGVTQSADVQEIKSAHRRLMELYHPDRVDSLGPELKALAEAKSKESNSAYDEGLRARRST